jgi:hypothetical protein
MKKVKQTLLQESLSQMVQSLRPIQHSRYE